MSFSMDDEDLYGPRLFETSVRDMIADGWLAPFEISASVITTTSVMEQIENGGWTDEYDPDDLDAVGDLAAVVYTLAAAKQFGLKRILTFHNRVEKAQRAVEQFDKVSASLGIPVQAMAVSAESGKKARHDAVAMLKEEAPEKINIVANVNLFNEGVNTPALDAVVYFDPKSTPIGIVQSLGRALTTHPGKEKAYVLVPVFVDDASNAEEALEGSRYDKIYKLGSALRDLGITAEQIETVQTDDATRVITKRAEASFNAVVHIPEGWDAALFEAATRAILLTGSYRDPADLAMDHFSAAQFTEWMTRFASPIFNQNVGAEEKVVVDLLRKSVFDFAAEVGIKI